MLFFFFFFLPDLPQYVMFLNTHFEQRSRFGSPIFLLKGPTDVIEIAQANLQKPIAVLHKTSMKPHLVAVSRHAASNKAGC